MNHHFTIFGEPVGCQRHRDAKSKDGRKKWKYLPQKTKDYEELVKWSFVKSLKGEKWKILDIPIQVKLVAYFNCPKKYRRPNGGFIAIKSTKPDNDNIEKSVFDGLKGVAWKDDCLIWDNQTSKYHTLDNPRCEVIIMW